MNRFKRTIMNKGTVLGAGCERRAFLYNDKVYKFPFGEQSQGDFEKDIYELMPSEFKVFFPNPKFIGSITEMDYVEVAKKHPNAYYYYRYSGHVEEDLIESWEDTPLAHFCDDEGIYIDVPLFEAFMVWFSEQGGLLTDILDNIGNFGHDPDTYHLKIVDWGWSQKEQEQEYYEPDFITW